jgi:hypothetical protein
LKIFPEFPLLKRNFRVSLADLQGMLFGPDLEGENITR